MKHETRYAYYIIPRIIRMAACSGFFINSNTKILDFGCGDGHDVYAWRDEGYDAYGFDLYDTVKLRSEADRRFFKTSSTAGAEDPSDTRFNSAAFRLPYENETFDLVISSTVLEHVQDHDAIFAELSRVMKKTSIGFHTFPAVYTFIEPHIHIPFGTIFKSRWYYQLWACLGIRGKYQKSLSAGEVASENERYAKIGLSYKSPRKMKRLAAPYFTKIRYEPEFWEFPSKRYEWMVASKLYKVYYDHFKFAVLKTIKLPHGE